MPPGSPGRADAAALPTPQVTQLNLRSGDFVRIRSQAEILATLGTDGTLDGLPFMPEMAAWCGGVHRVASRAEKTCDTVHFAGQRRLRDTVHLDGLRCDGSAHGGCQAGCLTFWKEAWLARVSAEPPEPAARRTPSGGVTHDDLLAATRLAPPTPADRGARARPGAVDDTVYSCQATRLVEASERLRWFDPRQYVREVRSGNVAPHTAVVRTAVYLFNSLQNVTRRFLPARARLRGGGWYPFVYGRLTTTPREALDLAPGDIVEVKSKDEILATLDTHGRNRGMSFDGEMAPYCGERRTVLRRVDRLVDEKTGRMRELGTDAIVLEGVVCTGRYHGMCPRAIYPYWREIWLRRVDTADEARPARTDTTGEEVRPARRADADRGPRCPPMTPPRKTTRAGR